MAKKTILKIHQMYHYLNNKYWNNSLFEPILVIQEIKNTYGEYLCPDSILKDKKENYKIIINARMHWRHKHSIRQTLLHEMCHHAIFLQNKQKYWNNQILWHGKEWRREMERVGFKKPIRATS